MSGRQALTANLEKIEIDICSNKITIRQKGLEKLDQILNERSDELTELLSSRSDSGFPSTTWIHLFDSAHQAVIQQSNRYSETLDKKAIELLESRSAIYKIVIQKLLNTANANSLQISIDNILEKCFHCFENRTLSKFFGECYLQILNKHVLCSVTGNLGDIRTSSWCSKFL